MIVAGEKHMEEFVWGKAEIFHTVQQDDQEFRLFEQIRITKKRGKTIEGELIYISEKYIDLLSEGNPPRRVELKKIDTISSY